MTVKIRNVFNFCEIDTFVMVDEHARGKKTFVLPKPYLVEVCIEDNRQLNSKESITNFGAVYDS